MYLPIHANSNLPATFEKLIFFRKAFFFSNEACCVESFLASAQRNLYKIMY